MSSKLGISLIVALAALLSGCGAYRVNVEGGTPDATSELRIEQLNEFPEGVHCFEPYLYVISLGIIPAHCVNRFSIETVEPDGETVETYTAEVVSMQGWVALFLLPTPTWRHDNGSDIEDYLEQHFAEAEQ